jgi:hypothetical protein
LGAAFLTAEEALGCSEWESLRKPASPHLILLFGFLLDRRFGLDTLLNRRLGLDTLLLLLDRRFFLDWSLFLDGLLAG